MRLMVIGGSGTLGRHVVEVAGQRNHVVISPPRRDFDIARTEHYTLAVLQEIVGSMDVVVNCAGTIPSRMAVSSHGKASPAEMALTNAAGPHMLAAMCAATRTRLIHMSTDCVFSGKEGWQRAGCMPEARPDPDTLYGRTKLAGEPVAPHVLVVRGSFIDHSAGFLHWLLRERGVVDAWRCAYWSGSSARRMAELLVNEAESPTANGKVVHAASEDIVTKAQLVAAFAERLDLPVNINITDRPVIYRGLLPTPGFELPPVMQVVNELADEVQRVSA